MLWGSVNKGSRPMMQDGAGVDDGPRMIRMGSSMGLRLEDVTSGLTSVIVSLTEHGTEGFWRRGSMFGGDCEDGVAST